VPRPPLDAQIARLRRKRAAVDVEAQRLDAAIAALTEAQTALVDVVVAERARKGQRLSLHAKQNTYILPTVQGKTDDLEDMPLGVRIAAGRKDQTASRKAQIALGLTDAEVAKTCGVARGTVSRWHTGSLRIPARYRVALEALGIPSIAWLRR
jgi:transcriptional regulator with XRE-family HTH domain